MPIVVGVFLLKYTVLTVMPFKLATALY